MIVHKKILNSFKGLFNITKFRSIIQKWLKLFIMILWIKLNLDRHNDHAPLLVTWNIFVTAKNSKIGIASILIELSTLVYQCINSSTINSNTHAPSHLEVIVKTNGFKAISWIWSIKKSEILSITTIRKHIKISFNMNSNLILQVIKRQWFTPFRPFGDVSRWCWICIETKIWR